MSTAKIILMRGIQGSGKTTESYMIQERNPDFVRVSRDEIRMQTYGRYHGGAIDEDLITEVETAMVRAALRLDKTVIVDAMHLKQSYINRWQRLGYPVEIVECHLPLGELLRRNGSRTQRMVPASVIDSNYRKFTNKDGTLKKVKLEPEKYVTSEFPKYDTFKDITKPSAYIFDIDGTLAHNDGHRSYYDYTQVKFDKVHDDVADVADYLGRGGAINIIVTGRPASAIPDTENWLQGNRIPYDAIYSRGDGDSRPDALVKYEILRDKIAPHYNVAGVFDDRPSVCEMWRNVGITTFQVGDPDVRF